MDPITVSIVSALAAGAVAAAKDVATGAVKDAYARLKRLITDRYERAAPCADAVEADPTSEPEQRVLAKQLDQAGAPDDERLKAAAEALLDALESLRSEPLARAMFDFNRLRAAKNFELEDIETAGTVLRAREAEFEGDFKAKGIRRRRESEGRDRRGREPASPPQPEPLPPSPAMQSEATKERRIGIWIGEGSEALSEPLHLNVTYALNFKVGALVPGSLVSGPETEVPSTDVPPGGLGTQWVITSSTVELASGTPDTAVETKTIGRSATWTARFSLLIPERGESAVPQLRVTPRTSREAHLDVVIFVRNEAYRTFALELAVKESGAASAGRPAALRGEIVHAPAGHLSLRTLHEWTTPPGTLSIAVLGPNAYARGDAGHGFVDQVTEWHGAQALVAGKIENARSATERFRARWEDYLNDIDPDDLADRLKHWRPDYSWGALGDRGDPHHRRGWDEVSVSQELRDLAFDGHRLYEAFFPARSDLRVWLDSLAPGQRLNISWLPTGNPGWLPHVPWGLMYLTDVPAPGDPVDPMSFLGLRFRLSYTAHPVQAPSKALGRLEETYGAFCLYWGDNPQDLTGVEARWQQQLWATLQNQVFIPTAPGPNAKAELLKLLSEPEPPPVAVLYLFCQCNVGEGNDPVLRFGSTSQPADVLRRTELGTKLLESQPLVFANACTTAAGDPYLANELEEIFFDRGCRAYLGTETKIPIRLASRFASVFFHFFYRRADPAPMAAGEAVAQARLFLWTHYRNIGGLFYTYVNLYELFMASDAEVVALRA